jgi:hypothetical protein
MSRFVPVSPRFPLPENTALHERGLARLARDIARAPATLRTLSSSAPGRIIAQEVQLSPARADLLRQSYDINPAMFLAVAASIARVPKVSDASMVGHDRPVNWQHEGSASMFDDLSNPDPYEPQ